MEGVAFAASHLSLLSVPRLRSALSAIDHIVLCSTPFFPAEQHIEEECACTATVKPEAAMKLSHPPSRGASCVPSTRPRMDFATKMILLPP